MKLHKLTFALLVSFLSLLVPQHSYAKETWLKCEGDKSYGKDKEGKDIKMQYVIFLDSSKEMFEIEQDSKVFKGKANYFKSYISFDFVNVLEPKGTTKNAANGYYKYSFSIDRASLDFSVENTLNIASWNSKSTSTGSCRVIPAPASPSNKI
jgi:hypothetical protein